MLIAAAVLFIFAMLLAFIDKWRDNTELDLSRIYRLLIFVSAMLIGLKICI